MRQYHNNTVVPINTHLFATRIYRKEHLVNNYTFPSKSTCSKAMLYLKAKLYLKAMLFLLHIKRHIRHELDLIIHLKASLTKTYQITPISLSPRVRWSLSRRQTWATYPPSGSWYSNSNGPRTWSRCAQTPSAAYTGSWSSSFWRHLWRTSDHRCQSPPHHRTRSGRWPWSLGCDWSQRQIFSDGRTPRGAAHQRSSPCARPRGRGPLRTPCCRRPMSLPR